MKKLDHENIVKVIGFVENLEEGTLWIIFPWQVNGNLREFVRSENWEFPERSSLVSTFSLTIRHSRSQDDRSMMLQEDWLTSTNWNPQFVTGI